MSQQDPTPSNSPAGEAADPTTALSAADPAAPATPALVRAFGPFTGAMLIVANMIGVGVFTTAGYMIGELRSAPAVLLAWLVGGVAAFCGAVTYAELGAALPRNGGEYQLLSRIYHPAAGVVAGLISLVVGFAAPLALYANLFGKYVAEFVPCLPAQAAGLCLLAGCATLHALHVGRAGRFHNALTVGKIALILLFVGAGCLKGDRSRLAGMDAVPVLQVAWSGPFAVQLIYVSFSYSGWNASAYLAGEFRDARRAVPLAALAGTCLVTLLYLALNATFLAAADALALAGQQDVARIAAAGLMGETGSKVVALIIAFGLVSTVSAATLAGSRVAEAFGRDMPRLGFLALRRADGGPVAAICMQTALAAALLLTASFETLLGYIGVTLSLTAVATVLGVFVLRLREPSLGRPYRTWGFPVTPLLFVMLEGWMIAHSIWQRPKAAAYGGLTIALGLVLFLVVRGDMRPGAGLSAHQVSRPGAN
jgi:APA family basic amino acid/polyamine antiporter